MRDLVDREEAANAPRQFIKGCNPEHFLGQQKFIEFMDNAEIGSFGNWQFANGFNMGLTAAEVAIKKLPPIQPERDIPMKPNETIDSSWGIRKKQAICPKCDYYLGRVEFIGNPNGKKVTYCETCGQAIDWEGWEWDE